MRRLGLRRLRQRVRVVRSLVLAVAMWAPCCRNIWGRCDLATGIFAELERGFGDAVRCVFNEEWSCEWAGWAELVGLIQDAAALPDDTYLAVALGYVRRVLRKFRLLAYQTMAVTHASDADRRAELERGGLAFGHASGSRNNCLADSLL